MGPGMGIFYRCSMESLADPTCHVFMGNTALLPSVSFFFFRSELSCLQEDVPVFSVVLNLIKRKWKCNFEPVPRYDTLICPLQIHSSNRAQSMNTFLFSFIFKQKLQHLTLLEVSVKMSLEIPEYKQINKQNKLCTGYFDIITAISNIFV